MKEIAIPFITIIIVFFLNLMIKKKLFCISSVVLLYWIVCVGGAFFVYKNPRTGFPFVSHDAMVYLAKCSVFLLLPFLFVKDKTIHHEVISHDFRVLDSKRDLWWNLVVVLLIAELCFASNIGELIRFFRSGLDRESFRLTIDRSIRGHIFATLGALCMLPAKFAMFLSFAYLFFGKEKQQKKLAIFLLIGSFAISFWSLQQVDRRESGKIMFQLVTCTVIFLEYVSKEKRRSIIKLCGLVLCALLIPFLAISIVRYSGGMSDDTTINNADNWIYQMAQYFSAGPYFFNADYCAVTEYGLPLFYGDYNLPLVSQLINPAIGIEPEIRAAEMWQNNDIFHIVYYQISQCHPFEFKTLVGCLILDFPTHYVFFALLAFCCITSMYFHFAKFSMAYLFFLFLYAYSMLFGTILYPFSYAVFNAELIVLLGCGCVFAAFIHRNRIGFQVANTPESQDGNPQELHEVSNLEFQNVPR